MGAFQRSRQWDYIRGDKGAAKKAGIFEINATASVGAQVSKLEKKLDMVLEGMGKQMTQACVIYASPQHVSHECPSSGSFPKYFQEQA